MADSSNRSVAWFAETFFNMNDRRYIPSEKFMWAIANDKIEFKNASDPVEWNIEYDVAYIILDDVNHDVWEVVHGE